jgi:hypothetical protein
MPATSTVPYKKPYASAAMTLMLAADVRYGIRLGLGKELASRPLGLNQRIRAARAKRTLPGAWPTLGAELKRSELEHGLNSQKCNDGMADSDENIPATRDAGPLPQADAA